MFAHQMTCDECSRRYPVDQPLNLCPHCGGLLEIEYDLERLQHGLNWEQLAGRTPSMWKWREFLPLQNPAHIVSLGEGGTPLIPSVYAGPALGIQLYFKNDALMPTGSFKDRGFSLAISKAKELGITQGLTYTSGNAGASFAAYAGRADMQVVVLVKHWTTAEKLVMIRSYGHEVVKLVYDSFGEVTSLLDEAVQRLGLYQFVNFINPVRHEAMKTYAYELTEQLGGPPDRVIQPVGTGGGIWGAFKGFRELEALGRIPTIPSMHGVQPSATPPLAEAFQRGDRVAVQSGDSTATIAQSIASDSPLKGGKRVLRAAYESGGSVEAVPDREILRAMQMLSREGIFAEPAGAAPLAALWQLADRGELRPGEKVVCVVTGTGLKQPEAAALNLKQDLHTIPCRFSDLAGLLDTLWAPPGPRKE